MRVVIGTGGTAGHVFPALATAERLRDGMGADVTFVGRAEGQEARLIPSAGFPLETVEALPFRRRVSLATLKVPIAALRAARRCRTVVRGADAVVGMGGYVSVPVSLAARRERSPLIVHEQNALPGLANRLAARWARVVALSFEEGAHRLPRRARTVVTGNPVRGSVLRVRQDRRLLASQAATELDLEEGRQTVIIFGGSQGALRLNRAAMELCAVLGQRSDLQVLVLTGPSHHDAVLGSLPPTSGLRVRALPFLDRMELAYARADLAVARAGATTVAELTACGIPAVLVPYPHATGGHQEANARAVERAGGATILLDEEVTGRSLAARVAGLLDDPRRLERMAGASEALGRPEAAEALAGVIASVAEGARR